VDALSQLEWTARRSFWGALSRLKFSQTAPLVVPPPSDDGDPIVPVPFAHRHPDIPIKGVFVADHAPADETVVKARVFCALQAWLARRFAPMQAGLPPADADPFLALATAYPAANRRLYRAPVRPPGYDPLDLGLLAVASPYSCYLERVADSGSEPRYRWDLTGLEPYPCHPGVRSPWAKVDFAPDPSGSGLRAVCIESALGTSKPGSADWVAAQHLAMCAVSTHLTLVRHFHWLHLVFGASLGIATPNCLPAHHPVRILLQPHVYATSFGNEIVTRIALQPGGEFEHIFGLTHRGLCDLLSDTVGQFDLEQCHPERDAATRGVTDVPGGTPALDNRLQLWRVIHDHVERFLAVYYPTVNDLRGDLPFTRWLDTLTALIRKGVPELAGSPVTIAGAVELLATVIYLTTVEHEILDSNVYDYQLWNDVQPARVYENGAAPPLDVYLRLVDYNFILSVERTLLMTDFSSLAPDGAGRAAFRRFREDLAALQAQMSQEPEQVWRLEPRMLRANMNY
jgi:arachidonate 15-lipoxygenase